MPAASAEKKRIVSKVFRAGSGLSRTPVSAARCEALPLKFSDGAWLPASLLRRLSSESIRLEQIASGVNKRHASRESCSRAKFPRFLLAYFSCFFLKSRRENFLTTSGCAGLQSSFARLHPRRSDSRPTGWTRGADGPYLNNVMPPRNGTFAFPAVLSATGAFSNLSTLSPSTGLIPFTVNSPLWSDAAIKSRWIAVPNDGPPYTSDEQISFVPVGEWPSRMERSSSSTSS